MVAVAQLVESRIVIPVVAGSIPVGHPTYFPPLLNSLKIKDFLVVLIRLSVAL